MSDSLFSPDVKLEPYWWEAAPRPKLEPQPLPERVDVASVGSGFAETVEPLAHVWPLSLGLTM